MFDLEIPLLVNQADFPQIPLFDSTQLHVSFNLLLNVFFLLIDR